MQKIAYYRGMVITSYGMSCFKVSSGETVLAFDPPSKKSKLKSPYFQTDMALISHDHDDHNGRDALHGKGDSPLFLIESPGEYEYKGIFVRGISSFHDNVKGAKHGKNTVYRVVLEDIVLLHLGDFGEREIRKEIKEQVSGIDVLFLPVGGQNVLDVAEAVKIAGDIEPRIIIPMHYDGMPNKKKETLKELFREMGMSEVRAENKFTCKKKDLLQEETRIVVLESII